MPKVLEILLLVLAPLAWGLLMSQVFEQVRRWRRRRRRREEADP